MTEILLGLLIGLLVVQAFRLKSWVINIILILVTSSVLTAELTSIHEVLPFVSILLLLAVNVLLNQQKFEFSGLLALNLCLLLHVISAYISPQNSFLLISLFALVYSLTKIISNQQWLNGLLLLFIALWSMLIESTYWQTIACIFWILLLYKQQFKLINDHSRSTTNDGDILDQIETAQSNERSRIYQNIHDDVGAELLQLIYELDDDVHRNRVKSVMNKLRQAVANTAHINIKADRLLKEICDEGLARCDAAGLTFIQNINLVANPQLSQTQPIHLQRTVRELINNCLKHANATTITLSAQVNEDSIEVSLQDDGQGMVVNNAQGKGMLSLYKRVASEGGNIKWLDSNTGGTLVKLKVML